MKAEDVIKQLRAVLPKISSVFTDTVAISSLTRSGSTVTATTSANHGLVNDNFVSITGAFEPNTITSLTRSGTTATVVTAADHDLTEIGIAQAIIYSFNQATISGTAETDYNGEFNVLSANNRRTFTYAVSGSPSTPATGTPVLFQDTGYNGRFQVTVTGKKTFTYEISTTPTSPAQGTILAKKEARVSGAVSLQRAIDGYTKQDDGKLYAFVVVGDVDISKDRSIVNDATTTMSAQNEWRQRLIEPFSVYLFVPSTGSISARPARDTAEDVRALFYQSLLGAKFPTTLADDVWSLVTANGDRMVGESSTKAVYVHEFRFERIIDATYADTSLPDNNVAFRDFNFDSVIEFGIEGTGDLDADIDLDDAPL